MRLSTSQVAVCGSLFLARAAVGQRVLVWEDTFDGDSLNETVWSINTGNGCDQGDGLCGWGNFEQQAYTRDNHEVANGILTITADREATTVYERWYTSSRIRSKPPVHFLTGRVEASIKLPAGLGLWAAFWMLPSNTTRGEWAATGEMDIMEAVNDMESVLGTIHYGSTYPANRYAGCMQSSGQDFSGDFHLFAMEWEMDEIRWYVDDQLYCLRTLWTSDLDSFEPYRAPFDTEFELLLNLAVGGSLPGRFVDDTIFPASMMVDYIRVYDISAEEPVAEPFLGMPLCIPGTIEAEAFDIGGLGLGYGETQSESTAGTYRTDGTGLVGKVSGRTVLANLTVGDWTAYTVVAEGAQYDITLEVSTTANAELQLIIGDNVTCADPGNGSLTARVAVEATGDIGEWGLTDIPAVFIPAGTHRLKLCILGGVGTDVDRMTFSLLGGSLESSFTTSDCATSGQRVPYMFGEPWAIPGYIEAEYYDYGGLGVGFFEQSPMSNSGASTLRLPDGVDVIEAESNPAHGHYIGHWETGEWLSFTSKAEVAGSWDVGASVASGFNGTLIEFRILVNATNCSSAETDGFDGLGSEGVDLLNGPVRHGYTGSWEAFEVASKPDVFVPQGNHRLLFCADGGIFNLNYLWFWTPNPTPAPTPVPSPAPTGAPQVSSNVGIDNKWIYISVACVLGLAALSRLGWIVYLKEDARRRKPAAGLDPYNSNNTSRDDNNGDVSKGSPPDGANGHVENSQQTSSTARGIELDLLSVDTVAVGATASAGGAGGVVVAGTHSNGVHEQDQSQRYRDATSGDAQRDSGAARTVPRLHSPDGANAGGGAGHRRAYTSGTGHSISRESFSRPTSPDPFRSAPGEGLPFRRPSAVQPLVSPVESSVSVGPRSMGSLKTPRASAGLDVEMAGSLWDRGGTISPLQSKTPARTPVHPMPKRDQFEDALVRALGNKWEAAKFAQANPMTTISRASSYSEGGPRKTPMLAAGKCWTCVCAFENSVGQESCLGCGRVAPLRRPSGGSTPARKHVPSHRRNSSIAPPADAWEGAS